MDRCAARRLPRANDLRLEFSFLTYDDIFEKVELSAWETMQAVWKLSRSAVGSALSRQRVVLSGVSDGIKWTAGYVVAWVEDEDFKERTRKRVLDTMVAEQPDVVLAHSLGSLITYNAFSHPEAGRRAAAEAIARSRYVSLGSQIGNPFVVGNQVVGCEQLPSGRHAI